MPIVTKLRRVCKECGEMFVPSGKHQKYCLRCIEKKRIKNEIR